MRKQPPVVEDEGDGKRKKRARGPFARTHPGPAGDSEAEETGGNGAETNGRGRGGV